MKDIIDIRLLDYTDLIAEINFYNEKQLEDYLAGKERNEDEATYLQSLKMEHVRRAETGNFNDHRDNA